jgi:hypothetical protein
MKALILVILSLLYINQVFGQELNSNEIDSLPKVILQEDKAKELRDTLLMRLDAVLKQYQRERRNESQTDEPTSEDLLRTAIKRYMYLKHVYGLYDKNLFTELVFDKGVIVSRQLRSIPITLMFQKDKTALYGTNMPHSAVCDGSCGKCSGPSNENNK